MQFNFAFSTNEPAAKLWQNLGYEIVPRLPLAFHYPTRGFVDAFVMFARLSPDRGSRHRRQKALVHGGLHHLCRRKSGTHLTSWSFKMQTLIVGIGALGGTIA